MNTQQKEKAELIELFGVHFENYYNLPPLASRILGTLIMNSRVKGMTFDGLVESTGASKSSVSTNLNLLLKLGKINYYTLSGDRKKYFRCSPTSERIQNQLQFLDSEKAMVNKVREYEGRFPNEDESPEKIKHMETYMKCLAEFEDLLKRAIREMDFCGTEMNK
ncbi:GbsR/MarR family transcriptional regulator [Flavobacterium sp. '19STA2R22 D10 B1']|uniref:GbsR/MarR family transcriptional regulator n=1 Tax=Flavobacterium aerium TaxID=3037261 RepID=UPI00278C290D|nr:hypothetical protein [Flavobacterium sp. '19STA2R22 D10 B1']